MKAAIFDVDGTLLDSMSVWEDIGERYLASQNITAEKNLRAALHTMSLEHPEDMTGKKVVVVGGGAVGLDVVEFFAARNAEISIVEMMDQIGRDLDPVTKNDMKDQMKKHHVAQLTKTALQEVKDSSFLVKDVEGERELPFDYGFVCLGMRAQGQLFTELSDAFVSDDVEILNIGDSKRARRIIDGTLEGRNILNTLTQMGYL